jgi:hypothetical protein
MKYRMRINGSPTVYVATAESEIKAIALAAEEYFDTKVEITKKSEACYYQAEGYSVNGFVSVQIRVDFLPEEEK